MEAGSGCSAMQRFGGPPLLSLPQELLQDLGLGRVICKALRSASSSSAILLRAERLREKGPEREVAAALAAFPNARRVVIDFGRRGGLLRRSTLTPPRRLGGHAGHADRDAGAMCCASSSSHACSASHTRLSDAELLEATLLALSRRERRRDAACGLPDITAAASAVSSIALLHLPCSPPSLASLAHLAPQLTELEISDVSYATSVELGSFHALASLADARRRSDAAIQLATSLPALKSLSLAYSSFSPDAVASLSALTNLQRLSLCGAMECPGGEAQAAGAQRAVLTLPQLRQLRLPMAVASASAALFESDGEDEDESDWGDARAARLPAGAWLEPGPGLGLGLGTGLLGFHRVDAAGGAAVRPAADSCGSAASSELGSCGGSEAGNDEVSTRGVVDGTGSDTDSDNNRFGADFPPSPTPTGPPPQPQSPHRGPAVTWAPPPAPRRPPPQAARSAAAARLRTALFGPPPPPAGLASAAAAAAGAPALLMAVPPVPSPESVLAAAAAAPSVSLFGAHPPHAGAKVPPAEGFPAPAALQLPLLPAIIAPSPTATALFPRAPAAATGAVSAAPALGLAATAAAASAGAVAAPSMAGRAAARQQQQQRPGRRQWGQPQEAAAGFSFPPHLADLTLPLCSLNRALFEAVCHHYGAAAATAPANAAASASHGTTAGPGCLPASAPALRSLHIPALAGYSQWDGSFLTSERDFAALARLGPGLQSLHVTVDKSALRPAPSALGACMARLRGLTGLRELRISEARQPLCFSTRKLSAATRAGGGAAGFGPSAPASTFACLASTTPAPNASGPNRGVAGVASTLEALQTAWPQMRVLSVFGETAVRDGGRLRVPRGLEDAALMPGACACCTEPHMVGAPRQSEGRWESIPGKQTLCC
ncbi:hypothetical protein HYH03_009863 [Edaphochlamys debaryana]|uniref:Uncharacterized protein n=1 Tax=Edaphochlamys debaryana TaxID=47281 RepID=A0A835Y0N2_9CHLO|nr:hypothetical protein HYH03_009863 [Edaphochlamys debaryana]|eukprot:KAG2491916.1 hypothetical protein HYH03_009863 [Edaphochlamys debaryana]